MIFSIIHQLGSAKKKVQAVKYPATGGGPEGKPPNAAEQLYLDLNQATCELKGIQGGFDTSLEVVEGTLIHIYGKVFKLTILGTCSFSLSLSLGFTWGPSSV